MSQNLFHIQRLYISDQSISRFYYKKGDLLGNIKQTFIKTIARDMLEKYPKQFKVNDFQHNKLKVVELSNVDSAIIRNRDIG